MKVFGDKIFVKEEVEKPITDSGICIPETAIKNTTIGTVKYIGEGELLKNGSFKKPEVKIGDRVFYNKNSGCKVLIGNENLLVLREISILAILL